MVFFEEIVAEIRVVSAGGFSYSDYTLPEPGNAPVPEEFYA
jgi:hypothetical protein